MIICRKNTINLAGIGDIRNAQGITRIRFWGQYGIGPTTGSRYERGYNMPLTTALLIKLHQEETITNKSLSECRLHLGLKPGQRIFLQNLTEMRRSQGHDRAEFWNRYGISDVSGMRYERNSYMSNSTALLVTLRQHKKLTDSNLTNAIQLLTKLRETFQTSTAGFIAATGFVAAAEIATQPVSNEGEAMEFALSKHIARRRILEALGRQRYAAN